MLISPASRRERQEHPWYTMTRYSNLPMNFRLMRDPVSKARWTVVEWNLRLTTDLCMHVNIHESVPVAMYIKNTQIKKIKCEH